MSAWKAAKRNARQKIEDHVRTYLQETLNHTANFIDERRGISGGVEFRVLTRASGECICAIRVEAE